MKWDTLQGGPTEIAEANEGGMKEAGTSWGDLGFS
jgi:hypothetical protein